MWLMFVLYSCIFVILFDNFICAYRERVLTFGKSWGQGTSGQLGDGLSTSSNIPLDVSGVTTAVSLTGGFDFTCVGLGDGTASCFGSNAEGYFGDSTFTQSATATAYGEGASDIVEIRAGRIMSCVLYASGAVECAGNNAQGQLGAGFTSAVSSPLNTLQATLVLPATSSPSTAPTVLPTTLAPTFIPTTLTPTLLPTSQAPSPAPTPPTTNAPSNLPPTKSPTCEYPPLLDIMWVVDGSSSMVASQYYFQNATAFISAFARRQDLSISNTRMGYLEFSGIFDGEVSVSICIWILCLVAIIIDVLVRVPTRRPRRVIIL
jgi:hypothetical protein